VVIPFRGRSVDSSQTPSAADNLARRSRNQNGHHHGVTERNGVFLSGSHETRKKNSNVFSLSFLASWFPYKFACFTPVCSPLVKIFVEWQEING
jgi:hypothetical protein